MQIEINILVDKSRERRPIKIELGNAAICVTKSAISNPALSNPSAEP